MPLHRIYTVPGLYSDADKKAIASTLTALYENIGLPKFYVITLFHELEPNNIYVGEESYDERKKSMNGRPFVRILSQHIARTVVEPERRLRVTEALTNALKPFLTDRGYMYEFNIEEAPGDMAREMDFPFPAPGSEAEKRWRADNHATAYEGPTLADFINEKANEHANGGNEHANGSNGHSAL